MDQDIVLHKGYYWPKKDGSGSGVTETYAPQDSCCFHLLYTYPDIPTKIAEHIKEKKVVVQAGGNCGVYVKQYAELFETVYTFEPSPVLFYCLNLNVTNSNVYKFQACIGNTRQPVSMKSYLPDVGGTHVGDVGDTPQFLIDDLNLNRCDLIHLDIEGFELFALQGAINTINKYKPTIVIEYAEIWLNRYGYNLSIIDKYLNNIGYVFDTSIYNGDRLYITKYNYI